MGELPLSDPLMVARVEPIPTILDWVEAAVEDVPASTLMEARRFVLEKLGTSPEALLHLVNEFHAAKVLARMQQRTGLWTFETAYRVRPSFWLTRMRRPSSRASGPPTR